LNDLTGHGGAAILQGVDGVSVTIGCLCLAAKVGDDRLIRLWRLRHNTGRIGHKRSRPSFETPRKSAALRMTDECVDAQGAETNYPADFSYLKHKRKVPLTIANLVSHQ
jgi:hypothetical protein